MAENPNIELAQSIMIEKFGLDETTYRLESFSEGSKAVSIKMSDGEIVVSAKLPLYVLEFEKIRRMGVEERKAMFYTLQPKWQKVPMEVRELFKDIVDNWDSLDDLPTLKVNIDPDSVETTGIYPAPTGSSKPKTPARNKPSVRKPAVKAKKGK